MHDRLRRTRQEVWGKQPESRFIHTRPLTDFDAELNYNSVRQEAHSYTALAMEPGGWRGPRRVAPLPTLAQGDGDESRD